MKIEHLTHLSKSSNYIVGMCVCVCVCVEPNLKYLSVECSCALEPSLDIENMPLKQRIPFVESM